MSVLTVLQLDGGARGSVQLVSCGCPQTRWCSFFGSEVENSSVTFVEKSVNFGGGEVLCVCVNCQFWAVRVCVGGVACQLGFGIWVASQMPNQVDR